MQSPPILHHLSDDGIVPNNAELPLVLYRGALSSGDARQVLALFAFNQWAGGWVDGIYDFQHYHSNAHEVLGIVEGSASVQFGGAGGPVLTVAAGDVIVIPAGVGHCRTSDDHRLVVVGAYPHGQENVDLMRASVADREAAKHRIRTVALPGADPVYGTTGPLIAIWSAASRS